MPACVMDSGILIFFLSLGTKKGLCSQYFPPSSDRAAAFLSTPSKVTACSAEASTCQMYACFVAHRFFIAFAVSIELPFFFPVMKRKCEEQNGSLGGIQARGVSLLSLSEFTGITKC